jgi:hypothetical protein
MFILLECTFTMQLPKLLVQSDLPGYSSAPFLFSVSSKQLEYWTRAIFWGLDVHRDLGALLVDQYDRMASSRALQTWNCNAHQMNRGGQQGNCDWGLLASNLDLTRPDCSVGAV